MKKFFAFTTLLLLLLAGASWAGHEIGAAAKYAVAGENSSGIPENIADALPYTPSAAFRFSVRQLRTLVTPGSRSRIWTPSGFEHSVAFVRNSYPVSLSFGLPDGVKPECTANVLITSPVRAGPEYILS